MDYKALKNSIVELDGGRKAFQLGKLCFWVRKAYVGGARAENGEERTARTGSSGRSF